MNFASAYLALGGITTIGFGLAYAVRSSRMARMVDLELPSAAARADYRSIYAGSQVAIGIFFVIAARSSAWLAPGLAAVAFFACGFGVARLSSLALDRAKWQFQYIVGALEIGAGAIAAWLFFSLSGRLVGL
ncbi:MAG: DUF4345 family protein [Chthoniobacterales bacterium]